MKPMNEQAKNLTEAIERMRKNGWWRGDDYPRKPDHVCIVTSFRGKLFNSTARHALEQAIAEKYQERTNPYHSKIISFNDHPDTTRTDVDWVMHRALVLHIQEGAAA